MPNHDCSKHLVQLFIDTLNPGRAHIAHTLKYGAYSICRRCGNLYISEPIEEDPDHVLFSVIEDRKLIRDILYHSSVWNKYIMDNEKPAVTENYLNITSKA